ncbi:unnamed protein product [Rotaria sp. Silwood1]|nr:unnamed protein product [Rotaria sp. Silwood1]CAF1543770.1 unnamed protein product [Rotaria sp. Silwood1]
MNLADFGEEHLNDGTFNRMLEDVGIGDVGSFLDQFRNEAHNETKRSRQVARDEPDYDLPRVDSTFQNAQKMYALYKQFDRNGDGKITADDIEKYLQQAGLGGASPFLAKAIFQTVDQNHNGSLDFTDLMALVTILNKLYGQYGYSAQ